MLEEDYLSKQKHSSLRGNDLSSQVLRQIIIPRLTKEVNQGASFVRLRQMYNSLILAIWYKMKIQNNILKFMYTDKNKVEGVNVKDPRIKEKIYRQYLMAFKKGVYNYIKEERDSLTQQPISRKYISGGFSLSQTRAVMVFSKRVLRSPHNFLGIGVNLAMLSDERIPFRRSIHIGLIDWEITSQCALTKSCPHCYIKNQHLLLPGVAEFGDRELSFEEKLRVVDLLHASGINTISFCGGEPFDVERFDELCRYVKSKGMRITIVTNGLAFSQKGDQFFIRIKKEGKSHLVPVEDFLPLLGQINFSLDTVDPHSWRGKTPGYLRPLMRYIKKTATRLNLDLETQLTTTVLQINKREIMDDVSAYVAQMYLDILQDNPHAIPPFWKFNLFLPQVASSEDRQAQGTTFEEYKEVYEHCREVLRRALNEYNERIGGKINVEELIRIASVSQEFENYRYLLLLPNGVAVTTIFDKERLSPQRVPLVDYKVLGYFGIQLGPKEEPWIYREMSELVARAVSDKLKTIPTQFYAKAAEVVKEKSDSKGGIDWTKMGLSLLSSRQYQSQVQPDMAQLINLQRACGFIPQIIAVEQIKDLPAYLGLTK